jgi:hypothetical protein
MKVHNEIIAAAIVLLIACFLFGCSSFMRYRTEAFTDYNTDVPLGMCGVDLPPCQYPLRCINGYCKSDQQPGLPESSGLPVEPQGYTRL